MFAQRVPLFPPQASTTAESVDHLFFLLCAVTGAVAVLVTDVWMDRVTGLEVLARLCAISPKTKVIVITAREDLDARATAMAIGPVAYFMKPFDHEKFLAALHKALATE